MARAPAFDLDAILARHGVTADAFRQRLAVTDATVRHWRRRSRKMSVNHCLDAERLFKIPKYELRPDLWQPPPEHIVVAREAMKRAPARRAATK